MNQTMGEVGGKCRAKKTVSAWACLFSSQLKGIAGSYPVNTEVSSVTSTGRRSLISFKQLEKVTAASTRRQRVTSHYGSLSKETTVARATYIRFKSFTYEGFWKVMYFTDNKLRKNRDERFSFYR